MHKRLVVGVLAFILAGCALFNSGYKIKINKEEQESDYSSVYAEIIEFDGIKNKDYQSELNLSVEKDVENAITQFDSLALDAKETLPKGIKSALSIKQKLKRNSSDIISFISEHYIYTGGAHGTTSWYPRTIDLVSNNPHDLKLGELFDDEDYLKKLNAIIDRMVKDNPDKYSELWEKPELTADNEDRFYMTDTDLVIFFPPYELSYYAKGFVEFPIPFEELNPILNKRYKSTK